MTQLSSVQGPTPLKRLVKFTSATAGLEKTLRLIQAVTQIAGEVSSDASIASKCFTARDQLALGRRYFRLLDFYGCFERVQELLAGSSFTDKGAILTMMEMAQFTFLGMYLLLENLTILHDMNVHRVSWYKALLTEANKFWFYALVLSIARASWEVLFSPVFGRHEGNEKEKKEKKGENGEKGSKTPPSPARPSKWPLVKQILVDSCDLTLPGSFVGWVPVGGLEIGLAMVVSTVLAAQDIWVGTW